MATHARHGSRRPRIAAIAPLFAVFALSTATSGPHCETDALGRVFCAKTPKGTAVVDDLGRVLCAPGACVEADGEWTCSTRVDGNAGTTLEGPICDGGCRAPAANECREI